MKFVLIIALACLMRVDCQDTTTAAPTTTTAASPTTTTAAGPTTTTAAGPTTTTAASQTTTTAAPTTTTAGPGTTTTAGPDTTTTMAPTTTTTAKPTTTTKRPKTTTKAPSPHICACTVSEKPLCSFKNRRAMKRWNRNHPKCIAYHWCKKKRYCKPEQCLCRVYDPNSSDC